MPLAAGSAYVGAWINHSKGTILGATLTLPSGYGSILQNILVLLVTLTGVHFWGLTCFVLHRLRSTPRANDGLYYQQQILLRSRMPSTEALWRLLELGFAWRSHTKGSFRRTIGLFLIAFINFAGFITAGILSSRITSSDSEVLARGKCGFIKGANETTQELAQNDPEIANVLYSAAYTSFRDESSYARSCYGTQLDRRTADCSIYSVTFIPSTQNDPAPCPFTEAACSSPAVTFDTGIMSSDKHFGINAHPRDRVHMRKTLSCAPIANERYATNWTSEQKPGLESQFEFLAPNDTYKYFNFGPSFINGVKAVDYSAVFSSTSLNFQDQPYQLISNTFFPQNVQESNFIPIPDLNHNDADITMLFLSSSVIYTGEVKDPWFKASTETNTTYGINNIYHPDEMVSVIGCTEQYQFCNGDRCSPLSGFYALNRDYPPDIGLNKLQKATYQLMFTYAEYMQLGVMLQFLRNEILLATQLVYGAIPISSPVKDNQWQDEMANLHNITLAGFQAHGVIHAAPGNTEVKPGINLHDFIIPETTVEGLKLCDNQKFRSTKYASFNFLGLLLIILLGFFIIVLNITLPPTVGWIQGKSQKGRISKQAWVEDDILQLQRIALESKGIGPWHGRGSAVPVIDSYGMKFRRGEYAEAGEEISLDDISKFPQGQYIGVTEDVQLNDPHQPLHQ